MFPPPSTIKRGKLLYSLDFITLALLYWTGPWIKCGLGSPLTKYWRNTCWRTFTLATHRFTVRVLDMDHTDLEVKNTHYGGVHFIRTTIFLCRWFTSQSTLVQSVGTFSGLNQYCKQQHRSDQIFIWAQISEFIRCKQQIRRPAGTSTQADQHLLKV